MSPEDFVKRINDAVGLGPGYARLVPERPVPWGFFWIAGSGMGVMCAAVRADDGTWNDVASVGQRMYESGLVPDLLGAHFQDLESYASAIVEEFNSFG